MKIERQYTYDEVVDVVQLLHEAARRCAVMTFQGPIGAGKTTLIRAFLKSLGVTEPVVSPTFTYVSCYRTAAGRAVYHFDLYRIERAAQFESMGFLDYLHEPGALIIIEWPEVIASLLTMPVCAITLDYAPTADKRSCILTMTGA
jgi:tRNA threonylcarbamoyladenosine biosynthesis protein TsaE